MPIALGKFLEINPQIKVLNLYLDNDKAGKNSIAKINYLLGKSYQIYDKGPKKMKDVNEGRSWIKFVTFYYARRK